VAAGLVLGTAFHFTWLARIGRIDMPLTLTVAVAVAAVYLADGRSRLGSSPALLLAAYLAVAAGVLLKGPIGLVLAAAVVAAYRLLERRPLLRGLGLWWGVPLVLALTLPWFLWATAATDGEFFRVFVWHHNVERGIGGSQLRGHPWWFYGPQFAGDFLPWTPVFAVALWVSVRKEILRRDPEARLGLVWFLTVAVVLSCARFKRGDYLLPAYPGAALFLGCVLLHGATGTRRLVVISAAAFLVALGWLVRVEWGLPATEPQRDYTRFAAEIRKRAPPPAGVLFFRTEAHALAFRVGRPLDVLVEWEELRTRVSRPGPHYVVMPPEVAAAAPAACPEVVFEPVLSNLDLAGGSHERPLVLLRAGTVARVARGP
jgi:4-amino-4-deoxy-L-arabinose transferase-like glycosyltransferase